MVAKILTGILGCAVIVTGFASAPRSDDQFSRQGSSAAQVLELESLAEQGAHSPGMVEWYVEKFSVSEAVAKRNTAAEQAFTDLGGAAATIASDRFSSTYLEHGEVPILEVRLTEGARDPKLEQEILNLSPW